MVITALREIELHACELLEHVDEAVSRFVVNVEGFGGESLDYVELIRIYRKIFWYRTDNVEGEVHVRFETHHVAPDTNDWIGLVCVIVDNEIEPVLIVEYAHALVIEGLASPQNSPSNALVHSPL